MKPLRSLSRPWRGPAIALGCAALLAGCLTRPALVKESFAMPTPTVRSTPAPGGQVLGLRNIAVSPLFAGKSFVYRTGEHSFERDSYAEFLVPPALAFLGPLRAHLRNTGLFADVTETDSALVPARLAEIHLGELYGDFRSPNEAFAVLSLRVLLLADAPGKGGHVALQKDYARRLPLPRRTAAALAAGWSQALEEIGAELAADLRASEHK